MLELELVRLAYAELLHRWGFDEERVQVLKLCRGARVSIAKYAYSSKRIAVLNGLDEKNGLGSSRFPFEDVVLELTQSYCPDLSPCCGDCGAVLLRGHTACIRCKKRQKPAACIICHLFIQGLSSLPDLPSDGTFLIRVSPIGLTSNCSNCGHVGHLDCLEKWYESEADCPTGCGCR